MRLHRGRLDHRAVGREIAFEHREATTCEQWIRARTNHIGVVDLGAGDVLAERLAVDGERRWIEQIGELGEHRAEATRVIEILHQVLARRTNVGEHRRALRKRVELREVEIDAGALCCRNQMDDGVGRSTECQHAGDGVVDCALVDNVADAEIRPHHLDDPLAGQRRHLRMSRIRGGDRCVTGERHAHRFGRAGHRRCGAHRHAVTGRARDAVLDFPPVIFVDVACAKLRPVLPRVGSTAQILALVIAAEHRTRGDEDRRQVHRQRAHDEPRRRLVAAAHQHATVGRIRAQQLFGFHRQQIAIEHRCRLLERLGERQRWHLDRKSAGLPDAALHFFGALAKMAVA